jgi:Uma2 family endonuclease
MDIMPLNSGRLKGVEAMTIDPQQTYLHPGGPMSVEEYLQLDENAPNARYEYMGGVARLMAGGTIEHNRIGRNVTNEIDLNFRSGPCTVFGDNVLVLVGKKSNGREHYVYPDVTVTCDVADRRRGNTLIRSPRIVVEVLSPSTEALDRGAKLEAYKACPTIQEIVLIDQFEQAVEVYRRDEQDDTIWQHVFYGPGSTVELRSVDVFITMDEIYKGINFDEPLMED